MTIDEVADHLRISPSTIYRLLKRKALPAFRIGSDWRFDRAKIDAWVAKQGEDDGAEQDPK
jgi:excisionase family DNA binding protein